jgi:hypothetical protein
LEYCPSSQYYSPEDTTAEWEKNEAVNADEAGVLEEFGKARKVRPDFSDAKFGLFVTNWHQTDAEP